MKSRLLYFFKYFLFWLSFLLFFKLTFIIYHIQKLKGVSIDGFIGIFTHGFKLDLSLTGYLVFFPALVLIIYSFFRSRMLLRVINIYTILLLLCVSLLLIIDHELYNYWGFRLDDTFLDYISTPKEMLASIELVNYLLLLVIVGIIYFVSYHMYYKRWVIHGLEKLPDGSWKSSLVFLLLLPVLFLMIRGGTGTATLNVGSVYFHKNMIVNHSAVNPIWNLIYSATKKSKLDYSVNFFDEKKEKEVLGRLDYSETGTPNFISGKTPNIIVIILESFGGTVIKEISGREGITPVFSKLVSEGMFFSNIYASGTLSDRGIAAIISGYPALPETCILHYEGKTQNLPSISKSLKELDYQSRFFYGGDINFAHIKGYLVNCQFDQIISHKDFPKSEYLSKWGVPDHIVFDKLFEESNIASEPFFHVYFTLSSHEPFVVPMETVIEGNSREDKFFNSVYYTDKSLGDFVEKARQQEWWDNTLVLLVADHGTRIGTKTHCDTARFHIPMLWFGGALNCPDTIISKYGSQTDIPSTLINQLGVSTDEYPFSKNLLSSESKSYAYFTCQNGFSFITDSLYLFYDLTSNSYMEEEGVRNDFEYDLGKAYLQNILRDFSSR